MLCRSEQRIAKDRAIRVKQQGRLLADIEKLAQRVASQKLVKPNKINQAIGRLKERYPRVARYYKLCHDPKTATLVAQFDADKHRKAEQLDGCYLLKTDRKNLSADELWRIYTLLTRAENAFRDMKTPLAIRPIFHHLEPRTDTHILMCSRDCSWFGRMADWCEQDLRRLRVRTAVAFHDSCSSRESVVAATRIAA